MLLYYILTDSTLHNMSAACNIFDIFDTAKSHCEVLSHYETVGKLQVIVYICKYVRIIASSLL